MQAALNVEEAGSSFSKIAYEAYNLSERKSDI